MGGFSTGAVIDRAPAAFVIGTVAAMAEIHQAAQTTGVEALRRVHPKLVQDLDQATKELKDATGLRSIEGWKVDRPMALRGKQKEWTTKMAEKRTEALLQAATRRQRVAIHASTGDAGKYLSPPEKEEHKVADLQFRVATLRRCGQPCHPEDKHCRNIRGTGERCGAKLDPHGHHGAVCECGGALMRRHDGLRDLLLKRLAEHTGAATHVEQRVEDMNNSGRREARLDVAVTIPGAPTNYLDVAVVEAYSANAGIELQRERKAMAAEAMEGKKRSKYGANDRLVPFVVETHGRLGPAATRWLKKAYKGLPDARRDLLMEISAHIQAHTASMVVGSAS